MMNLTTDTTLPLAVLGRRLQVGPPQVAHLIGLFENGEMVADFVKLVREYLPEHEAEIMAHTAMERVSLFMQLFEPRYFPLQDYGFDDEEAYHFIVMAPDIPRLGMSWDEYHEIPDYDQQPGLVLLYSLVACPFARWDGQDGSAERVPLLAKCEELVGANQAWRIPAEGWEPEYLHERLDGTFFEGAALLADWLYHQTDTIFLDVDYEMQNDLDWSRETVDELCRLWRRACQIQDSVSDLAQWLEGTPTKRFKELLDKIGAPKAAPRELLVETEEPERVRVRV
jgi:hypothetical protein